MKNISTLLAVLVALIATPVAAQTYGSYSSSYVMTNSCIGLSRDVGLGARGADIRALQQFLVNRNYPGSGAWMVTGYFGKATEAAVRNFQSAQALSQTGYVDGSTRLAIDRVSCGQSSLPAISTPLYAAPLSYVAPVAPSVPLYTNYTGYPYFGGNYNTSYRNPGTVYACDGYNTNGCPCMYSGVTPSLYGNNCGANAPLAITHLSPAQSGTGSSVTIFGSGFSTTNNTVRFGNGILTGLNSPDGRSVSFVVPSTLSGYGGQTVVPGTYYVSVSNSSGATSNTLPFVVNSVGSTLAPTISSITGPTSLAVGATGQWTITVNTPALSSYSTVSVQWGDPVYGAYLAAPQQLYGTGIQSTTFSHVYSQAGTYTITFTVTNAQGQTSTSAQTVIVSGTGASGSISLMSAAPTYAPVGAQVMLTGTGFTQDNTIHFGIGGTQHVPSWNGTTLYYTIPQYLSPCDVMGQGAFCTLSLQQVTAASYPVYVTNTNGTSQTVFVQVQ